MAARLPELSGAEFARRLALSGCEVSEGLIAALHAHYCELRRWAARVALVGAGEGPAIVERHYAESLRALALIGDASRVLDLGSGAGFPGLVLAAARPDLEFWLFESRARKAAFLRAAAARARLSCRIEAARVSKRQQVTEAVPSGTVDLVTVRGVRMDRDIWEGLEPGLAPGARILRWEGAAPVEPWPDARSGRSIELPGSAIREWLYTPRAEDR